MARRHRQTTEHLHWKVPVSPHLSTYLLLLNWSQIVNSQEINFKNHQQRQLLSLKITSLFQFQIIIFVNFQGLNPLSLFQSRAINIRRGLLLITPTLRFTDIVFLLAYIR